MNRVVGAFVLSQLVCGCATSPLSIDRTPVLLEGVVVRPLSGGGMFGHGNIVTDYSSELSLVDRQDPSVTRLMVFSPKQVPDDHLLREIGAAVIFQTEKGLLKRRPYTVGADPTVHYSYYLQLGTLTALHRKLPNKAPEPTPMSVTPRATEGVSK